MTPEKAFLWPWPVQFLQYRILFWGFNTLDQKVPCGFGLTCWPKIIRDNQECLVYCDDHVCDDKFFKCPGFYCVPWRFVCNGGWECPGGTDENSCVQEACPGMFKCKNSSVCISYQNLCDLVPDCWFGEDEYFCPKGDQVLQPCPSKWTVPKSEVCPQHFLHQFPSFYVELTAHIRHPLTGIQLHTGNGWWILDLLITLSGNGLDLLVHRNKGTETVANSVTPING